MIGYLKRLIWMVILVVHCSFICSSTNVCDEVYCPPFHVCFHGACICNNTNCSPPIPEFVVEEICDLIQCSGGFTCLEGKCIPDIKCMGVKCSSLKKCVNGKCVCINENCEQLVVLDFDAVNLSPCSDVTCPLPFICIEGVCKCGGDSCPVDLATKVDESTTILSTGTAEQFNVCSSNPCKNGCRCIQSCKHENGYYCESAGGFIGKNCEIASPIVKCLRNKITASVNSTLLNQFYPSFDFPCIYIGGASGILDSDKCLTCTPEDGVFTVELVLPFQGCGLSIQSKPANVLFSSHLWASYTSNLYELPIPLLKFQCSYDQEYSVFTAVEPVLEKQTFSLHHQVELKGTIKLCKIAHACPASCPTLYKVAAGAAYAIGETIHLILSMDKFHKFADRRFVLEDLYLACTSSSLPSSVVSLVSKGCETSLLSSRIDRSLSTKTVICASFKVPRLLCSRPLFYIHAKLRSMSENDVPDCSVPASRSKRSFISNDRVDYARFGPIYFLHSSEGKSNISLSIPEDISNLQSKTALDLNKDSVIISMAIVSFISMCLVVALFLVLNRR